MRITLVRHGRPDEGHAERPHDPPLAEEGRRQAQAVARLLAGEGVDRIVASPLARAHETALPLAQRLQLPVHTLDGWAEADRHQARYRSTETLRALGPQEWARFLQDPVSYLGGDPVAFRAGVLQALQAVQAVQGVHTVPAVQEPAHVVVFTHGLPINVVLSHVLQLPRIVHFRPDYGSVTRLQASQGRLGIVSVNEGAHHRFA